jgi:copper ion binding protein
MLTLGQIPYGGILLIETAFDVKGADMSTVTVRVAGMTCAHCASSVHDEVGSIAGVTAVDVDLSTGKVTVESDNPVDNDALKAAVEEAGYQLAG